MSAAIPESEKTATAAPPHSRPGGIQGRLLRVRRYIREHTLPLMLGGLVFMFLVVYLANRIFIFIGPGEAGVLFRRLQSGTQINHIYGEGMSIIAPWNRMYIYNVRVQEHPETVKALSSNGLTISVDVSMRYMPDYPELPFLHQKVGPDYAAKVVVPEVIAGVREVIGKYKPDELYTIKTSAISDAIIRNVVRSLKEKFITLDDVNIKKISLPPIVTLAIENKLKQEQLAKEYEFRIERERFEAERLAIQSDGIARFNSGIIPTLTPELLRFKGIEATLELSTSPNSKVVVVGGGSDGLPLILNTDGTNPAAPVDLLPKPTKTK
jgi:regulator of protease activity HflC (stomatin/prohibitin superfamily)